MNKKISIQIPITGVKSPFSSLDFVIIIMDIELNLYEKTGKKIVLANEKTFSRGNSLFVKIESLTNYILELVGDT